MTAEKTLATLIAKLSLDASGFDKGITTVNEAVGKTSAALGVIGAAAAAAVGVTSKAAIDFESSFAGVKKTVEAPIGTNANDFFQNLEKDIRNMAMEVPASVHEIAGVYEAAGQLGISSEHLTTFSRAMIDLGNSTNLTSQEAATTLARFANITGMSETQFSNLGSSIVALGNNMATTEKEIADIAQNIAAAGSVAGLTEPDILGWGAAMSSMGLEAASGGTAFSTVLRDMTSSVNSGSGHIEQFAKAAGLSVKDFSDLFKTDANAAVLSFVQGLNGMDTGEFYKTLEGLEIGESRQIDTLTRLRQNTDLVSKALGISSDAWDENTALANEAAQRYETTASQFAMFKNELVDIGITIGQAFLPSIKDILATVKPIVKSFGDWAKQNPELITGLLKAGMALGAIGVALAGVQKTMSMLKTAKEVVNVLGNATKLGPVFTSIGTAASGAVSGIGTFIAGLNPIVLVIAAIIAVVALLYAAWTNNWFGMRDVLTNFWTNTLQPFFENVGAWITTAIANIGSFFGKIGNWFKQAGKDIGEFFGGIGDWIGTAFQNVGSWFSGAFDAVVGFFTGAPAKISAAISGWWAGITESVTKFKDDFLADLKEFDLKTAITNLAGKIGEGIATWWEGVTEDFEAFKKNIADAVGGISLIEEAKKVIESIKAGFTEKWTEITEWGNGLINKVKGWFGISPELDAAAKETMSSVKTGLEAKWGEAVTWGAGLVDDIKKWFGDRPEIKTEAEKIIASAKSGLTNKWEEAKTWGAALVTDVTGWFSSIDLFETGKGIINKLWDGLKDVWKSVSDWFLGIGESIGTAFKSAGDAIKGIFGGDKKKKQDTPTAEVPNMVAIDPTMGVSEEVLTSYLTLATNIGLVNTAVTALNLLLGNAEGTAFILSGLSLMISETLTTTFTDFAGLLSIGGVLGMALETMNRMLSTAGSTTSTLEVLTLINSFIGVDLTTTLTTFAALISLGGVFGDAVEDVNRRLSTEGSTTSMLQVMQQISAYIAGDFTKTHQAMADYWAGAYTFAIDSQIWLLWTSPNSLYNAYGAIFGVLTDIWKRMKDVVERIYGDLNPAFKATEEPAGIFQGAVESAAEAARGLGSDAANAAAQVRDLIAAMADLHGLPSVSKSTSGYNKAGDQKGGGIEDDRATGGPVRAGLTYLVGEVGPELFTPRRSGYIVPNDEAFGGGNGQGSKTTNININGDIYGENHLRHMMRQEAKMALQEAEFHGNA